MDLIILTKSLRMKGRLVCPHPKAKWAMCANNKYKQHQPGIPTKLLWHFVWCTTGSLNICHEWHLSTNTWISEALVYSGYLLTLRALYKGHEWYDSLWNFDFIVVNNREGWGLMSYETTRHKLWEDCFYWQVIQYSRHCGLFISLCLLENNH